MRREFGIVVCLTAFFVAYGYALYSIAFSQPKEECPVPEECVPGCGVGYDGCVFPMPSCYRGEEFKGGWFEGRHQLLLEIQEQENKDQQDQERSIEIFYNKIRELEWQEKVNDAKAFNQFLNRPEIQEIFDDAHYGKERNRARKH